MRRQRVGMLVDPLRRLLRRGALGHVANLLSKLHGADVARLTGFLNEDESREVMVVLLRDVPELAADVFSELGPVAAVRYFEGMEDSEITNVLAELASDDAAVLVSALPEDVAERILLLLERENRRQVEGLLGYEEETAGRIMSPQVFALHEDDSVGQAIDALRTSRSEELEMVFYLYVVDDRGHLVGVCSLRDLLLSDPRDTLKSVMRPRVMAVGVDTDQEEVARIVARYDYLAVPVVDDENKLVGIITVDDIIDIIREEESEDILLMAGVGEDEQEVLMAPLWRNTWLRLPWLFTAWIGGVLASQVIGHFEGLLTEVVALAAFIPVIAGMGGQRRNAGLYGCRARAGNWSSDTWPYLGGCPARDAGRPDPWHHLWFAADADYLLPVPENTVARSCRRHVDHLIDGAGVGGRGLDTDPAASFWCRSRDCYRPVCHHGHRCAGSDRVLHDRQRDAPVKNLSGQTPSAG